MREKVRDMEGFRRDFKGISEKGISYGRNCSRQDFEGEKKASGRRTTEYKAAER